MRALVKTGPHPGLVLKEEKTPEVGMNDVLIRVRYTSICGTDLHILNWDPWAATTIPAPMIVGHEFTGTVERHGAGVQGLPVGTRVSGEGHITCGHCRNCRGGRRNFCRNHLGLGVTRPGAFADYVVLPADNVFPVPDHIDDRTAAILDPLGNATHTALAFDVIGEDVLITGAGPIGLMAAAIVRHIGARHIAVTDINPRRLGMVSLFGNARPVDVRTETLDDVMGELGMTEGFDVGLEMSGAEPAFNQLLAAMNHGGRVAVLGIPPGPVELDLNNVIFKSLTVRGIYGRRIFETWYKMAAMLETGLDVSAVVTHEFAVESFEEGFDVAASGEAGKVLLDWS
ncbi:MAG TPA: L-threonine 3-dehydrogenase [Acidimicrobiia bacterium]|nr:L-threonine 3-dehydrogenase [Acidimicrobiia bacterium]